MHIIISNEQKALFIDETAVEQLVLSLLDFLDLKGETLSIRFVSKKEIAHLHQIHFNDPSVTDCITFPIDDENEPHRYIGECVICPEVARSYDQHAPYEELSLYITHTLLHLKGYRDLSEKEQTTMRSMEEKCLEHLKKKHLILHPPL